MTQVSNPNLNSNQSDHAARGEFIDREVNREIQSILWLQIAALLAINTAMSFADVIFGLPELRSIHLGIRGLSVLTMLVVYPFFRDRPAQLSFLVFGNCQIFGIGYTYAVYQKHALNLPVNGYLSEYIMVLQMLLIIGFCPFVSKRGLLLLASIYTALTGITISSVLPTHFLYWSTAGSAYFAAALTRILYLDLLRILHGIDYDLRRRMLPSQLVQKTLERPRGQLADGVKMGSTGIICIASGWHDYQGLFKHVLETDVADTLSSYYDQCLSAFDKKFAVGNATVDWNAENFLVYIPYDTQRPEEITEKAQLALDYAKEMIQVRREIFKLKKYPACLHVGLSLGRAHFGLSGTSNSRHMVAFGYPVIVARGIQHQLRSKAVASTASDSIGVSKDFYDCLSTEGVPKQIVGDQFLQKLRIDRIFELNSQI